MITVEIIYRWPGLGRWMVASVVRGDQGTLMTYVLTSVLFLIVNLIVDVVYANLDRRVTRIKMNERAFDNSHYNGDTAFKIRRFGFSEGCALIPPLL